MIWLLAFYRYALPNNSGSLGDVGRNPSRLIVKKQAPGLTSAPNLLES
jgi:hypothetical protein